MARSTIEVAFLSTQKLQFNSKDGSVKIVKVFYGDEPDGQTEHGLSVVSMDVPEEVADEIFAAGANIAPLEQVRITFEIARAGKQKGNNLCLHIEPIKPKADKPATPAQSPNTQAKA
jgi:hypothetical protein